MGRAHSPYGERVGTHGIWRMVVLCLQFNVAHVFVRVTLL